MKRLITLWVLLCAIIACMAQEAKTYTVENTASEVFKGVVIDMPDYREINSGSKFVVKYVGEFPPGMIGAFDYAVKLWEEVLPMTLPINIEVKTASIRGSRNVLSNVTYQWIECDGPMVNVNTSPLTMVKSVMLQEYYHQQIRFYYDITDTSVFKRNDISITYNSNLLSEFDFSLDGDINELKYDFVTVALRDIAMGLGLTTSFIADLANNRIITAEEKLPYFEDLVLGQLSRTDNKVAFANATKGSVEIPLYNWAQTKFGSISLYAPTTWVNGTSLRYFIPDENPLTKLLSYDFGKGYIMRDLSGVNWSDMFCALLDWRYEIATSAGGNNSTSETGTSEDILPYKGNITLSLNEKAKILSAEESLISPSHQQYSTELLDSESEQSDNMPIRDYCQLFNHYSPAGPPSYAGYSLSVLKNDGTWDCVYKNINIDDPIVLKIEDQKLNYPENEYARGTSGGLRYRLTKCKFKGSYRNQSYYDYNVKYFTRDYTPQEARINYTGETISPQSAYSTVTTTDDFFVDVKVDLAHVEGATKVVVEQLDEGEVLPFQYDVDDFRKGYFIANLDREVSTTLTVISYNDNGSKRSNTITIPPVGYPAQEIKFERLGDIIRVYELPENELLIGNIKYSTRSLSNILSNSSTNQLTDRDIDISSLQNGVYVLSIFRDNENLGSYKFIK